MGKIDYSKLTSKDVKSLKKKIDYSKLTKEDVQPVKADFTTQKQIGDPAARDMVPQNQSPAPTSQSETTPTESPIPQPTKFIPNPEAPKVLNEIGEMEHQLSGLKSQYDKKRSVWRGTETSPEGVVTANIDNGKDSPEALEMERNILTLQDNLNYKKDKLNPAKEVAAAFKLQDYLGNGSWKKDLIAEGKTEYQDANINPVYAYFTDANVKRVVDQHMVKGGFFNAKNIKTAVEQLEVYRVPSIAAKALKDIYVPKFGDNAHIAVDSDMQKTAVGQMSEVEKPFMKLMLDFQKAKTAYEYNPTDIKLIDAKNDAYQKMIDAHPEPGAFDVLTGKRLIGEQGSEEEIKTSTDINAKMDQYSQTPREQLLSMMRQRFLAIKAIGSDLDKERAIETDKGQYERMGVLTPEQKLVYDLSHQESEKTKYFQEQKYQFETDFEALSRLYYLNEDPANRLNSPTWGQRGKEILRGFAAKRGKEMGGSFRSIEEQKRVYLDIYNQSGVNLSEKDKELYEPSFADFAWEGAGGCARVGMEFALMGVPARAFGMSAKIAGIRATTPLTYLQRRKSAGDMTMTLSEAAKIVRARKVYATIADLTHQGLQFEAIAENPEDFATNFGEGVLFGGVMIGLGAAGKGIKKGITKMGDYAMTKDAGKLVADHIGKITDVGTPLMEKLRLMNAVSRYTWLKPTAQKLKNYAVIGKDVGLSLPKTSASLFAANNTIQIIKATANSLTQNEKFMKTLREQYQVDPDTKDWSDAQMRMRVELATGLVFGLFHAPERILGMSEQYKNTVETQMPYYESLYHKAKYWGKETEIEAKNLEEIISDKQKNLKLYYQQKRKLAAVQKAYENYAKKDLEYMEKNPDQYSERENIWQQKHIALKNQMIKKVEEDAGFTDEQKTIKKSFEIIVSRAKSVMGGYEYDPSLSGKSKAISSVQETLDNIRDDSRQVLETSLEQVNRMPEETEKEISDFSKAMAAHDEMAMKHKKLIKAIDDFESLQLKDADGKINQEAIDKIVNFYDQTANVIKSTDVDYEMLKTAGREKRKSTNYFSYNDEVIYKDRDGNEATGILVDDFGGKMVRIKHTKEDSDDSAFFVERGNTIGKVEPPKEVPSTGTHDAVAEVLSNPITGNTTVDNLAKSETYDQVAVDYLKDLDKQIENLIATGGTEEAIQEVRDIRDEIQRGIDEYHGVEAMKEEYENQKPGFTAIEIDQHNISLEGQQRAKKGESKVDILRDEIEKKKKILKETQNENIENSHSDAKNEKYEKDTEKEIETLKEVLPNFIQAEHNAKVEEDNKKEEEVKNEETKLPLPGVEKNKEEKIKEAQDWAFNNITETPDGEFKVIVSEPELGLTTELKDKSKEALVTKIFDYYNKLKAEKNPVNDTPPVFTQAELGRSVEEINRDFDEGEAFLRNLSGQNAQPLTFNPITEIKNLFHDIVKKTIDQQKLLGLGLPTEQSTLLTQLKEHIASNPNFNFGRWIRDKFFEGDIMVDPRTDPSKALEYESLSPEDKKGYIDMKKPFKDLPASVQKELMREIDNYLGDSNVVIGFKKISAAFVDSVKREQINKVKVDTENGVVNVDEKDMEDLINMRASEDNIDYENPVETIMDELLTSLRDEQEANDSEMMVDHYSKIFKPLYNRMANAGIIGEQEAFIGFIKSHDFKSAATTETKLKAFLDNIIDPNNLSVEPEHRIMANILRNAWDKPGLLKKGFNYNQLRSLINFTNSLNIVAFRGYRQIIYEGKVQGLGIHNMNQRDNQERFNTIFANHITKHIDFLLKNFRDEVPLMEIRDNTNAAYNDRLLAISALKAHQLIQSVPENGYGITLEAANKIYAKALWLLTGIDAKKWEQYFTLETERVYIRRSQKEGRVLKPQIIEALYTGDNRVLHHDTGAFSSTQKFFRYFTKGDSKEEMSDAPDNNLIKLNNVIFEQQFHFIDKDKRMSSAIEQDNGLIKMFKEILTDKYKTGFFVNNPIAQFYQKMGKTIPVMKIGKIFSEGHTAGESDISFDKMQTRDLERIMLQNYFDSPSTESYLMLHRIYSSKKQLYLVEVPKYLDAAEKYQEIYDALPQNLKESGFYMSPEYARTVALPKLLKRFLEQTETQYPNLHLAAQGIDEMYERLKSGKKTTDNNNENEVGSKTKQTQDPLEAKAKENENYRRQLNTEAIKAKISENLLNYIYNHGINSVHMDQLILGDIEKNWFAKDDKGEVLPVEKQNVNAIRREINKRLGSINSSGMSGTYSDNLEDGLSTKHENHLLLKDLMLEVPGHGKMKVADGAIFGIQEWFDRYANSMGTVVSKVGKGNAFNSLQCNKAIYFNMDNDGRVTITKGNRFSLDGLAKIGNQEKNQFKMIMDMIQKYNEGKTYDKQIHSVSFGPKSTTKLAATEFLDAFNPDGTIKEFTPAELEKSVEKRSMDNLLHQQDLRNSINPKDAKNPIQKKNNLAFFENSKLATNLEAAILKDSFKRAKNEWDRLIASDEESIKDPINKPSELRKFVLSLLDKELNPDVYSLIEGGLSLESPYIRRYLWNFVVNKINKDFIQNNINRVGVQEIPNMTGHELLSVRELSNIHIEGDKELGLEASAVNKQKRLLPQVDANIGENIPKGKLKKKILELTRAGSEINLWPGRERRYGKWFSYDDTNRKEIFDQAVEYANKYNDLHHIESDPAKPQFVGRIGKLDYSNIEEMETGMNGEAGKFFYVPGELVDVTRIPGHDVQSHPMGRLRKRIGEKGTELGNANYVMLPWEIVSSGGSDFDGDKRYLEALYTSQANEEATTPSNMFSYVKSKVFEIKQWSTNNTIMMLRAKMFAEGKYGDLLKQTLDKEKFENFIVQHSNEDLAQNDPSSVLETYKSNRLLNQTVGHLVSINGVFDAIRTIGVGIKPNTNQYGVKTSDKVIKISFPSKDANGNNSVKTLLVNGFSSDPHHLIKENIGILENIALDNKDDLYKLGINEHTSYMFAMLLFGDKTLDTENREDMNKKLDQRISDVIEFMHTPLMQQYTELMRKNLNLDENTKMGSIFDALGKGRGSIPLHDYFNTMRSAEFSNPLIDTVKSLEALYYAKEEVTNLYSLFKSSESIPKNVSEYISKIMTMGKLYFNDGSFLDVSALYANKRNLTPEQKNSKMLEFFGKKADKNGNHLSYLENPNEFFELHGLHPFVQGIASSLKMGAEIFKHELELSDAGKHLLRYFVSYNSMGTDGDMHKIAENSHTKYFTIAQAKNFSKSINNSVLALAEFRNRTNQYKNIEYSLVHELQSYQIQKEMSGAFNPFYELLEIRITKNKIGNVEQELTKVQLKKEFHQGKMSVETKQQAQEAFSQMPDDMQRMFITYMVQRYGASSSTWGGNYYALIPAKEKIKLSDSFARMKNKIMKNNYSTIDMAVMKTHMDYLSKLDMDKSGERSMLDVPENRMPKEFDPNDLFFYYSFAFNNPNGVIIEWNPELLNGEKQLQMSRVHDNPNPKNFLAAYKEFMDLPENRNIPEMKKNKLLRDMVLKLAKTLPKFIDKSDFETDKDKTFGSQMFNRLIVEERISENIGQPTEYKFLEVLERAIESLKNYEPNGKDVPHASSGINLEGFGTRLRGHDEVVTIPVGKKKYFAKVIAKRMSKQFGIRVVFADLGKHAPSKFLPGRMEMPAEYKGKIGEKKVQKAIDDKKAKNPALIVFNTREFDRVIGTHEFLHPFHEMMTSLSDQHGDGTLRRSWETDIRLLSAKSPEFSKAVEQIIAKETGKGRESELFAYFISHMVEKAHSNQTIVQRLKNKLFDLYEYAFDGLGIPMREVKADDLMNYTLGDVVNFFTERKRLDLSDFDFSAMMQNGSRMGQRMNKVQRDREQMIFKTLKIEAERKNYTTNDIEQFKSYWERGTNPEHPLFSNDPAVRPNIENTDYVGVFKVVGKLMSKEKGVFETAEQFVRNAALFNEYKHDGTRRFKFSISTHFAGLRDKIGKKNRDRNKSDVNKALLFMENEYHWNQYDKEAFKQAAGDDMEKLKNLDEQTQQVNKNVREGLFNIINEFKAGKKHEEIKRIIMNSSFADTFSDKSKIEEFADNIISVLSVYMPNETHWQSPTPFVDRESGLYDYITFLAPVVDNTGNIVKGGEYNIIKFRITDRKLWEKDGKEFVGPPLESVDENGQKKFTTNAPLLKSDGRTYDPALGGLESNKKNQFMLANATLATIIERHETAANPNNKSVRINKIIEIPLQPILDNDAIIKNDFSNGSVRDVEVVVNRDANGQMLGALETPFDDLMREYGKKIVNTASMVKNIQYKTEEDMIDNPDAPRGIYEGLQELMLPQNNVFSPKIGEFSKIAVKKAQIFLVTQFGKPLADITKQDMLDKCLYLGAGRMTRMLSKGHSIYEIGDMNMMQALLMQTNTDDKNELAIYSGSNIMAITSEMIRKQKYHVDETNWKDGLGFIFGTSTMKDGKNSRGEFLLPIWDRYRDRINANLPLSQRLTKDTEGYVYLNELSKRSDLLREIKELSNKENKEATKHLSDFIDQSLVTNQMMEWVVKESQPGFNGPKIASILLSEMYKNSPNLFRDFKSSMSRWDMIRFGMWFYPKAFIGIDTRPAQFITHLATQKQLIAFNEWSLKEKKIEEITKTVEDTDIEDLITTDPIMKTDAQGVPFEGESLNSHPRWLTMSEIAIDHPSGRGKTLTSAQKDFLAEVHKLEYEYYSHIEGFNTEQTPIPVQFSYQKLRYILFENKTSPLQAKRIFEALKPGKYDYMDIDYNGSPISFGDYKYHVADIDNWYSAAIHKDVGVHDPVFKDLLAKYEEAKENYHAKNEGDRPVGDRVVDDRKIITSNRQKEKIAAIKTRGEKRGNFRTTDVLTAFREQVKERVSQKIMGDIIPFYKVLGTEYEMQEDQLKSLDEKFRGGRARFLNMFSNEEKNIARYLRMVMRHDVYKDQVDGLTRRMPWVTNMLNNSIKWAAWWGISFNLHNQLYNVRTGMAQNFINEPMMMIDALTQTLTAGGLRRTTDYNGESKYKWDTDHVGVTLKDIIFANQVMAKSAHVGIQKEGVKPDPMDRIGSRFTDAGYSLVTAAERLNQGVLVSSYLNQIRPNGDLRTAYDKDMNIIPGKEHLAIQDWEVEQLKNITEGVHGYYGLSRAPYSYYAFGRALGLFRAPWMTAQLNNMFGKFKIDATQLERVGAINGSYHAIRALFHYARGTQKKLREEYATIGDKSIDDYKLMDMMLSKTHGFIEQDKGTYLFGGNRWATAYDNLPKPYKKAMVSAVLMSAMEALMLYFWWEATKKAKELITNSEGKRRAIKNMDRQEAIDHQNALLNKKMYWNLAGDISMLSPVFNYAEKPSALYGTWARAKKLAMAVTGEGAVAASRAGILGFDPMTEKQIYNKLRFSTSNGRKAHQPEGMRKVWDAGAGALPGGLGNLWNEYWKWTRQVDMPIIGNAGADWEDRRRAANFDWDTPETDTEGNILDAENMGEEDYWQDNSSTDNNQKEN